MSSADTTEDAKDTLGIGAPPDDKFKINEVQLSKSAVRKMNPQQLKELVDRIMAEQGP